MSAAARCPASLSPVRLRVRKGSSTIALEQQVAVAEDGEQAVVEVVGDAGREAADRLHLLRVQELALERLVLGLVALALRDVADGDHRDLLALEEVALAGDLDVDRRAVLAEGDALPRHTQEVHLAADEIGEATAEDLLRRAAEDRQQRVVDLQDDAVADDGDPFEGGLEQGAEALLAAPDLLLGRLALGDLLLRLLVEADVLRHRRDLVGDRRQQADVAGREVVVRVPAADQPDPDGLRLEHEGDHQTYPEEPGAAGARRQIAAALGEHRPQVLPRRLRRAGGDGLLVERLLPPLLEQIEGRLADQQGGQDLLGDHPPEDLAVERRGDARRDDADHLLRRVLDAEDVTVDERLEPVAQERHRRHIGEGDEQKDGEELGGQRLPVPAEDEEDHRVGREQQRREGVGAQQAVGPELQRAQVVLVDGVDVAHRQDRHRDQRDAEHVGGEQVQVPPRQGHVLEPDQEDAVEQQERHQPEHHAEQHDADGHPGGEVGRQDEAEAEQPDGEQRRRSGSTR